MLFRSLGPLHITRWPKIFIRSVTSRATTRRLSVDPEIYPMLGFVGFFTLLGVSFAYYKMREPPLRAPLWSTIWAPKDSGYRELMLPEGDPKKAVPDSPVSHTT
jgi:hypothetical protein